MRAVLLDMDEKVGSARGERPATTLSSVLAVLVDAKPVAVDVGEHREPLTLRVDVRVIYVATRIPNRLHGAAEVVDHDVYLEAVVAGGLSIGNPRSGHLTRRVVERQTTLVVGSQGPAEHVAVEGTGCRRIVTRHEEIAD